MSSNIFCIYCNHELDERPIPNYPFDNYLRLHCTNCNPHIIYSFIWRQDYSNLQCHMRYGKHVIHIYQKSKCYYGTNEEVSIPLDDLFNLSLEELIHKFEIIDLFG